MKIEKRHLLNYSILIPYLILSIIGLIVVYSTTSALAIQSGVSSIRMVRTQGLFFILSLLTIALIYKFSLDFLRNKKVLAVVIFIEVILLILSRFITDTVNGAHGWLTIPGGFSIQPAEYLKVILVWYLALIFSKRQDEIRDYDYQALTHNEWIPRNLNDWRWLTLILIGIVVIMPDLGNATILALTVLIMITASGVGYRWFTSLLGLVVGASTIVLGSIWIIGVDRVAKIPVFGYVAKRFSAFFNPFNDLSGAGHQLANSYYAMSNGGWFGLGLGNSIEKQGYLPEAHTDFVFAIVIEELGFVGASLILALLFFLILRIILVGIRAKNPFNSMMAIGIGGMILVQTFINIGGISGLIPSTGVTFPFLSQGGNSLWVLSVAIAFVLNIDASEKRAKMEQEGMVFEEKGKIKPYY
ncbi:MULTISPECIES: cell division peptidoglycan polymerase FtsW [Streptococcus]|jgi:ftsW/rodA/spoVE family cell division protein|uniref:Probable peptidoglycan glycosyltransferase FtsW n=1 Tax=Streptococcus parasanguinis TaxID=1318 RepID=A0A6L6LEE9_STRPA|nr:MULTISPECIES: FtsW/RodA/SpoVE family cell cycle protein [Streptococcus]MCP9036740.1 FtsW/RodA/SpoVE family cell cycle protein [Streptococcus sp. CF8_Ac1-9]MCP9044202.1 FtsW/RodA/SpoVE family cell cycle protein [Streptococcus sp. CF8_Ac1-11]MTR62135.1 FtsW/RodA/SpoVE family cell cycle protein [Streptococcus parasanguinis]MTR64535.1 FtsW/RodA/SpoVE family cell cycle protein [Streptococcus parasanguinis]MTR67898.1 FtsW/RodA/SpoVE family cell cycle protein [Streptococcus parasanguinis]